MAFSGVRPESLGDYTGMNGLVIGDFLEVELDNVAKRVTFKKTPSLVRVRKVISKKGHQMAKAIGEGAREVKGIELVMKKVGELDPEDFVSADAVAFGAPNTFGGVAGALKEFFDRDGRCMIRLLGNLL